MQDILFQITSFFFFVGLLVTVLSYLKLLSERGYSAKRLFIYLWETKRGRGILMGKISFVKWALILAYVATVFEPLDRPYHFLVALFYLILFLKVLILVFNRQIPLPKFSISTILVIFLTVTLEIVLFMFSPLDHFLWILILDKLLAIFLLLFLLLVSVFFDFGRDFALNRAIEKIVRHKKLLSIAVIGSYGRGSTKEFISHILALRYNVLETRETYSSTLSIAKMINSDLTAKKQIFIAEIDDYSKDDIAQMCMLINPKILVVCGINEQKLSVFGSLDKILSSKLEAVNSLSRDGIALFNGNSENTRRLYEMTTNKKFIYLVQDAAQAADIIATDVKEGKFSLSFNVSIRGKTYKLSNLKLLGRQNIENLLPAIFIGVYAGIDFALIRRELEKIRPLVRTMEPKSLASGAIIIDDTYNANINSVLRALSYIKLYHGKKVLVFEPLVELGKNTESVHQELGVIIGATCDFLFLTNDNSQKAIERGIMDAGSSCKISISTPAKVSKFIRRECGKDDVVLFVGRESATFLSGLGAQPVY